MYRYSDNNNDDGGGGRARFYKKHRGLYHEYGSSFGFLFGGQHLHMVCLSHLVYRFSFSDDVDDRNVHWERWSRLPDDPLFGMSFQAYSNDTIIMIGGSRFVGSHPTNEVVR
jgi:hypothetical protein